MIRELISLYSPSYPTVLVYMLQTGEYQVGPYLKWLWRTKDFSTVMQRRTLERTKAARMLLLALRLGILLQILGGGLLIYLGLNDAVPGGTFLGLALILSYPGVWAYLVVLPLILGRWLVAGPSEKQKIAASEQIFADHPGIRIAVAGSYGKTTMKEVLSTVLSEGLDVKATPANKNVSISHAHFAQNLTGKEDVLIIEYGEGAPGDVARFAKLTHPTHAIITGLSPAHLDRYKTLEAAGQDIFSLAGKVNASNAYVNDESPESQPFITHSYQRFSGHEALGWKVSQIKTNLEGTSFVMKKGNRQLKLHSGLVGRHQVGFLALAAALGLELGLTNEQVKAGIAKTKPFEHRMQPFPLNGAWVIDDTYNGNLEGIKAGTELLQTLEAKRKIYVTPGLVEQGRETERVHLEVGLLIAKAQPNIAVIMHNSVTAFIEQGLKDGGFKGELRIEDKPLDFYNNLAHFVASGDLVVMQNDWTDNYA